jgi:membrane fusion protein, multidrug efflux system
VIKRLILVLIALGLVFGGIFGWKYWQIQQMAALASVPPPPAVVAATPVSTQSWQPYLYAVGSLVARQGVYVSNEVAGQVQAIRFESGQGVKEGDVLVQLDDSVDQADLQGLIAERRLTEIQFERAARLVKDKLTARAEYDEAQANLQNAEAQVAAKQALIAKKRIVAPFSGLLGIREVDLGQYLAPGSRIVSLQALDPIFVDYALPERYLAALAVDQKVAVKVQAFPEQTFEGRISAISPRVETETRNVRVRGVLENPEGRLLPGMFAEVQTVLPEVRTVLTLPRTAITYNPYGDSVYVVEQQDGALVVQRRQVETGEVRAGQVEMVRGLQAGDEVVSAGQVKLRNGQHVRIDNSVDLEPKGGPS